MRYRVTENGKTFVTHNISGDSGRTLEKGLFFWGNKSYYVIVIGQQISESSLDEIKKKSKMPFVSEV